MHTELPGYPHLPLTRVFYQYNKLPNPFPNDIVGFKRHPKTLKQTHFDYINRVLRDLNAFLNDIVRIIGEPTIKNDGIIAIKHYCTR